jgi:demethylspheroidene O-methyltransferase
MRLLRRWTSFRDRLVTSPEFRRWAARNPLTRPSARRRARALFDLCAGFVYSQVLLACVQLRLFEILHEQPRSAADLAHRLALPLDAAERLVRAAAALRLLERRGDDYGLGPLGAAMIGNSGIAALVQHHALLYGDLQDPVALLRNQACKTALASYWPYACAKNPRALGHAETASYTALMSASQMLVAAEVLDSYAFDRHTCLLDIGAGDGSFLAAIAARAPHLRVIAFDLPSVACHARARFVAEGLTRRATAVGGDVFADPPPDGADLVSLVRVLHDHDDEAAREILRAARRVLPSRGTLLIAEPMSQTPGAEPVGDAYFGFYLMAMGRGRPRTPQEIVSLLHTAGFREARTLRTRIPLITSVIVATADC